MIASLPLPRPASFDALPASAAAISADLPRAEAARRPKPVEGSEPSAPVRRDQPTVFGAQQDEIDRDPPSPAGLPARILDGAGREERGRLGPGSTAFFAQLLGQDGQARDPVAAGRGQTSFRKSHVERYEEVSGWARRVELIFDFDGLISTVPAA